MSVEAAVKAAKRQKERGDGVMHGGVVVSQFYHREDMEMLYEDDPYGTPRAIGYVHWPTGQLFKLNGKFSNAKVQVDNPAGIVQYRDNKGHARRQAVVDRLLEEKEVPADNS